jgi:hypothetical protein
MKSKQIIMGAMLATQSLTALSAPLINDFEAPKAEYNKKQKELNVQTEFSQLPSNSNFKLANHDITYPLSEIIKEKITGIYENPFEKDKIMVLYFKENYKKIDKEQLSRDKGFLLGELIKLGGITIEDVEKLNYLIDYEIKNKDIGSYFNGNGNPQKESESDLNFVVVSNDQMKVFQKFGKDNGYDDKIVDIFEEFILYHEIAHSHDDNIVFDELIAQERTDLVEKFKKLKEENPSGSIKERILELEKDLEKLDKGVRISHLKKENYADVFSLLALAENFKKKDPINGLKDMQKFTELLMKDLRIDNVVSNDFNSHLTKPTIQTTIDFISSNWNIVDKFNNQEKKQLSEKITNETLYAPEIDILTHITGQQMSAMTGGISMPHMKEVSMNVNEKIKDILVKSFDENGDIVVKIDSEKDNTKYKVKRNDKPKLNKD